MTARWFLNGLGGVPACGRLFGFTEDFVDDRLPPGASSNAVWCSEASMASALSNAWDIVTLRFFIWSPNLVWFAIALAVYLIAPYDIDAAAAGTESGHGPPLLFPRWVVDRIVVNFAVALPYYGFWHYSLYHASLAGRKYQPSGGRPTSANMVHTLFFWILGVLQWVAWECLMVRLWATGKVGFLSAAEVLASPAALATNVLWVLLVPLWRDVHFFIAHQFLHLRGLQKFVHGVHHRNVSSVPPSFIHPNELCAEKESVQREYLPEMNSNW